MAMYFAFNDWCSSTDTNPRLAFEAESSYQSIQIWRIDPYEFCPTQPNGIRKCPEDQSATFRTLPGFVSGDHSSQTCFQRFNVVAPTIAYVNEYNLAITVLETSFRNVDVNTLRPRNASDARSVVLLAAGWVGLVAKVVVTPRTASLALETVLTSVNVDVARLEHFLHLALHAKVFDDLSVDSLQALHPRIATTRESVDLLYTVIESLLVTGMLGGDLQNLIPICIHNPDGNTQVGKFCTIFWHVPGN
jgi:hypothetical protein